MERPPRTRTRLILLDVLPHLATAGYGDEAEAGATCCARGLAHAPTWARLVDRRHGPLGRTRLMYAARKGHLARLQQLLGMGADPSVADSTGALPVHHALPSRDNACAVPLIAVTPAPLLSRQLTWWGTRVITCSALGLAAFHGHAHALEALLGRGASATEPCGVFCGDTRKRYRRFVQPVPPVWYAALNAQLPTVHVLLFRGANPNCFAPGGRRTLLPSLLHLARWGTDTAGREAARDVALALLAAGADPTARAMPALPFAFGWVRKRAAPGEPWERAAKAGQYSVAQALAERTPPERRDADAASRLLGKLVLSSGDATPYAPLGDRDALLRALVAAGGDVNARDVATGETLVMAAARAGDVVAVRTLLPLRPDLDCVHSAKVVVKRVCLHQPTALLLAVVGKFQPVLEALLDAGAADAPTGASSALTTARTRCKPDTGIVLRIVQRLREFDAGSQTARECMYHAVAAGWVGVVEALISRGMDADRAWSNGQTSAQIAANRGDLAMVRALMAASKHPLMRLSTGDTPLERARRVSRIASHLDRRVRASPAPALPPPPDTRDLDALLAEIEGPPEAAAAAVVAPAKAARRRKGNKGGGGGGAAAAAAAVAPAATAAAASGEAPWPPAPHGTRGDGAAGEDDGDDDGGGYGGGGGAGVPSFVSMDDPATWTPEVGGAGSSPRAVGGYSRGSSSLDDSEWLLRDAAAAPRAATAATAGRLGTAPDDDQPLPCPAFPVPDPPVPDDDPPLLVEAVAAFAAWVQPAAPASTLSSSSPTGRAARDLASLSVAADELLADYAAAQRAAAAAAWRFSTAANRAALLPLQLDERGRAAADGAVGAAAVCNATGTAMAAALGRAAAALRCQVGCGSGE